MRGMAGGFIVGAATSAYQVEGGDTWADWYAYEGLKYPKSGLACDFWNRYREDIKAASELGLKALRISISWSRIEPQPSHFNDEAMDRYVDMVREIRSHGMEPIVTLHHFINPRWFTESNGWLRDDSPIIFRDFVKYVYDALGNRVTYWLTINEINLYVYLAYLAGIFPPFSTNIAYTWVALRNLIKAHEEAYSVLKSANNMVGIIIHVMPAKPRRRLSLVDNAVSIGLNYFLNKLIVNVLSGRNIPKWLGNVGKVDLDYVGLNYYYVAKVTLSPYTLLDINEHVIDPSGLRWAIRLVKRIGKPIMVTENGIDTANDEERVKFIESHIKVALKEGAIGYLYWSLLDSYEWERGFNASFGIIECSPHTLARRPRGSAYFLGELARRLYNDPA